MVLVVADEALTGNDPGALSMIALIALEIGDPRVFNFVVFFLHV